MGDFVEGFLLVFFLAIRCKNVAVFVPLQSRELVTLGCGGAAVDWPAAGWWSGASSCGGRAAACAPAHLLVAALSELVTLQLLLVTAHKESEQLRFR